MAGFLNPLNIQDNPDGTWTVMDEFKYGIGAPEGPAITVPRGFITDFASTPRILWAILPPYGSYRRAAVVHDWLYGTQEYGKPLADAIFLEAMEVLSVNWLVRYTVYLGVRLGGWYAWKSHSRAKKLVESVGGKYPVLKALEA